MTGTIHPLVAASDGCQDGEISARERWCCNTRADRDRLDAPARGRHL